MPAETAHYRLLYRGKAVGSHTLRSSRMGAVVQLEAKLMLQGTLGGSTVTQTSRLKLPGLQSLRFTEETQERNERRSYDVQFDETSGLVRASRGGNDQASIPYLRLYSDPLGILYKLRHLKPDEGRLTIPMLGKDVVVERLSEAVSMDTALGERQAYVYILSPGGSYVYIDTEAPHLILKLTQRLSGAALEALFVKVTHQDDPAPKESKKNRRGRRRPKRRSGKSGKTPDNNA